MRYIFCIILVVYFAFSAKEWSKIDKSDFAIPRWTEKQDSVLVKTKRITDDEVVKIMKDTGFKAMTVKEARLHTKNEEWSKELEAIER